jgi:hypothetical protein
MQRVIRHLARREFRCKLTTSSAAALRRHAIIRGDREASRRVFRNWRAFPTVLMTQINPYSGPAAYTVLRHIR